MKWLGVHSVKSTDLSVSAWLYPLLAMHSRASCLNSWNLSFSLYKMGITLVLRAVIRITLAGIK